MVWYVVFELLLDKNYVTTVNRQWCLKDSTKYKLENIYFHGIQFERLYDKGQRGSHRVSDLYLRHLTNREIKPTNTSVVIPTSSTDTSLPESPWAECC